MLLQGLQGFGRSVVICMPGQTSEQVGGERAGKRVRIEEKDLELIRARVTLVKHSSLETTSNLGVSYGTRFANPLVRGVYPEYGDMRSEIPSEGRWISPEDFQERRRAVFLGGEIAKQLFQGRPAVGETVQIAGMRFLVIGVLKKKLQFSSYFRPDERSVFIPYTAAADLWNTRYANALVFEAVTPELESQARDQVRAVLGERQGFSPSDNRALTMWGSEETHVILDGLGIGLQVLLTFIGILTLGIGGVGVMNIMLVSVDERTREIGLRRALGARRRHVIGQVLTETLCLTFLGGVVGFLVSYALVVVIGTLPLLGAMVKDDSGLGDIHLHISPATLLLSMGSLMLVGLLSGLFPALHASRLQPSDALRTE